MDNTLQTLAKYSLYPYLVLPASSANPLFNGEAGRYYDPVIQAIADAMRESFQDAPGIATTRAAPLVDSSLA